jgi:D,D-heptose 1,7-bisphosphate phosphatase
MSDELKKALFLDRDGIINKDKSYVYRYEDIEWMPGIFDLIRIANQQQFLVIVLTNQSGIERGYYTHQNVIDLHQQMDEFLKSQNVFIDDWFFSDSLSGEYRKPRPGMILDAQKKHKIDLTKSFMLGDKESDILDLVGPTYSLISGHYDLSNIPDDIQVFSDIEKYSKWFITKF